MKDQPLPLLPLQAVLFPDGLLNMTVLEPRYMGLVDRCWQMQQHFGVIAVRSLSGSTQVAGTPDTMLEDAGCEAELISIDRTQAQQWQVSCRGLRRFRPRALDHRAEGVIWADVSWIPPDPPMPPQANQVATAKALARAIRAMKHKGQVPFLEPYQFTNAAWIANRWCELLPISLPARQRLMGLTDPAARLDLVDQFLRSQGVVAD